MFLQYYFENEKIRNPQPCDLVLPHSELVKYSAVRECFRLFLVIDRRYGHTTPTMATAARASVVAIVGVVFTVIGKTNLEGL